MFAPRGAFCVPESEFRSFARLPGFLINIETVIPFGLKITYTVFVCALVPIYWRQYGPANFLWFSDIALLVLVPALWLENALLVSMMAVSVVFFEGFGISISFFVSRPVSP
jgi:hypothetical protein